MSSLRAEPPLDTRPLREASLAIHDAEWSLDGERIAPKRICRIAPGEENSVLRQGALLALLEDRSVAGLDLFGSPAESSLASSVHYQVSVEDGVLQDLGKWTHLEYLNLHGVDLTRGVGLECFKKLKHLRILRLTNCNVEIKQILTHLPECPELEIVKVWNDRFQWPDDSERFEKRQAITAVEVARFTNGSPRLRELFLQSTERYEPEAIAQFARLAELDYVHIRTVDNMPAASLSTVPQQHTAAGKLETLFTRRGFERWRHSGQHWSRTFTLPATSIAVQ